MGMGSDTLDTLEVVQVLNELLWLLCRSLPAYLADARPWTDSDDRQLRTALERLVADQQRYARRVDETIVSYGGRPDPGRFAMNLTAKNDLSLEFLRQEVINQQQQDIFRFERCAAEFENIPPLHALAEEILGNARGHLDILNETRKEER